MDDNVTISVFSSQAYHMGGTETRGGGRAFWARCFAVGLIHLTGEALRRLAQLCERSAALATYQDLSYCALICCAQPRRAKQLPSLPLSGMSQSYLGANVAPSRAVRGVLHSSVLTCVPRTERLAARFIYANVTESLSALRRCFSLRVCLSGVCVSSCSSSHG